MIHGCHLRVGSPLVKGFGRRFFFENRFFCSSIIFARMRSSIHAGGSSSPCSHLFTMPAGTLKMLESSLGDQPACILYCVTRFINVKDLSGFELIKVSLLFYRPFYFQSIDNDEALVRVACDFVLNSWFSDDLDGVCSLL